MMPSGDAGAPPSRKMKRPCTILVSDATFEDGSSKTIFECKMSAEDGGQILFIHGALLNDNDIRGGLSTLFSNEAEISSKRLIIPEGVSIIVDQKYTNQNDQSAKITGNRKV